MNNKLWLCGITNGPLESLKKLIEPSVHLFNGLCWAVDDTAPPEVFDYLESKKGEGKIIKHPFMQAHDWQLNQWLHCGAIKSGDKVFIMDSTDSFGSEFLEYLEATVMNWAVNGIYNIFLGRPWVITFTGHQFSQSSPHWGISNLLGSTIQLNNDDQYYVVNGRDKNKSAIEHPIKYFIEYKRSNASELLYRQFSDQIWQERELARINFQLYVENTLGFECIVDNLIKYISAGLQNKNLPEYVINYIESEVNMIDLVRYYILKQDLMSEIAVNRFDYSFKKFYFDGIEHQVPGGDYISDFNKYRLQKGLSRE